MELAITFRAPCTNVIDAANFQDIYAIPGKTRKG
jgi:hypothetical protein